MSWSTAKACSPGGSTQRPRIALYWALFATVVISIPLFHASPAQAVKWTWPSNWVNPLTTTSVYEDWGFDTCGYVNNWAHLGADSSGGSGSVKSIGSGTVVAVVSYNVGSGVVVQHVSTAGPFVAVYGHVDPLTSAGSVLAPGQQIGNVSDWDGNTHLHFSVIPGTYSSGMNVWGYRDCDTTPTNPGYVNPIPWLSANGPSGSTSGDLVFIKTKNSGTSRVQVFATSAASGFQKFVVNSSSAISASDANNGWFSLSDVDGDARPDLVFIKTKNSGTSRVQVFATSAASGFQKFVVNSSSAISASDADNGWFSLLRPG